MSIPIIGQQQGIPINVSLSVAPPMLTMQQGMITVTLPLEYGLAKKLKAGLDQIVENYESLENGLATPAAIPFRREGG
jgi:hypothetical protein